MRGVPYRCSNLPASKCKEAVNIDSYHAASILPIFDSSDEGNVMSHRLHVSRRGDFFYALIGMVLWASAYGAPIVVPNGDFSSVSNEGSIGGGLIGASGSAAIGSGPWNGTYFGVVGLLAPPVLTITPGHGTISGLAGINALSIVDNGGYFGQNLATAYGSNKHYILSADLDAGELLGPGSLSSGNAGLALTNGGTVVASTANGVGVSLDLLGGTTYRITLAYDTGAVVSGNVGVRLFAEPQNLTSQNLLGTVTFSNVTLNGGAINPVAAAIAPTSGTPQGATINTAFASPLVVTVIDADGDPVPNAMVTFTAPGVGASAVVAGGFPAILMTNAQGQVQIALTANGIAGGYNITATVDGVATPAAFALTNLAAAASSVGGATGTPQSAVVTTAFSVPLGVTVRDSGNNPVVGVTVNFSAPDSGPSALFPGGSTANTNGTGHAQINAVANSIAGAYQVTASVNGASTSAHFSLDNLAGAAVLAVPASGTPQSALVSNSFGAPLVARITDSYGNGISGFTVNFTAPVSGASAIVTPVSIATDSSGEATVNAAANATAGQYQVTASGSGLSTEAVFQLTNSSSPPTQGAAVCGGSSQSATVNTAFDHLLRILVTSDGSTPVAGVSIDFVAASSGPSATLSSGSSTGTTVTKLTDANGEVTVSATANGSPGAHTVSAGVTGSGTALVTFPLVNLTAGERRFHDGFDTTPACLP
jgi:hypothetical protein